MGFIERWMKEYQPRKDRCTNYKITSEITNHTVNIDDMQGCFLVLIFGKYLKTLLLLLRLTHVRTKNKLNYFYVNFCWRPQTSFILYYLLSFYTR